MEHVKFTYSPLGESFKKQIKTIEDQREKQKKKQFKIKYKLKQLKTILMMMKIVY